MLKLLSAISLAAAIMLDGGSSFVQAQVVQKQAPVACVKLPDETLKTVHEVYNDPTDVAKLNAVPGRIGEDPDTYVLIFDTATVGGEFGMEGAIYGLKNGCVVFSHEANETGVNRVFSAVGVNRKH